MGLVHNYGGLITCKFSPICAAHSWIDGMQQDSSLALLKLACFRASNSICHAGTNAQSSVSDLLSFSPQLH